MNAGARRDLLIVTCAISAGVHAALVPELFAESVVTGGGFIAATVLLALLILGLTLRPDSLTVVAATALTFVGLIVSYMVASTRGIAILHPDRDPVDAVGLITKAVELLGTALAVSIVRESRDACTAWFPFRHTEGARP